MIVNDIVANLQFLLIKRHTNLQKSNLALNVSEKTK